MKKLLYSIAAAAAALLLAGCSSADKSGQTGDADYKSGSVVYELNIRQMTPEGTFAAAAERLPVLRELGVDILWVMPPYPIGELNRKGTLGSYYAIRDYCDINPEFGTLEDFDAFLDRAHELGFRLIIDWVANHTSPDHPWVTGKDPSWYVRDEEGKTIVEYDWTDIAKLNYDNMEMRAEMEKCMRFWLDRGVDGFRCDMASLVPQDFWADVIGKFRSEYGDLYFLAEGEEEWLHEAGFDATYSWKLHHMLNDIAQGRSNVDSLASYIAWNSSEYPADALRLCFTSNHDENSWSGTEFDRMGDAWKAMTVLCWTLPNSQPLIYTGQEIGYDHSFEFFEKDPITDWKTNAVTDFYRELGRLKHSHPALNAGEGEFEILSTDDNTLVFRRSNAGDEVTVSVQLEAPWAWSINSPSDLISRVEPPCWWVGMKTGLQLLVQGEGIGAWDVAVEGGRGVSVAGVHTAESPNYLFVDIDIAADAKPGTYTLVFSKDGQTLRRPYEILARREGSAERKSFGTADAIYLLMPDRFVNGDPTNDDSPLMTEKADHDAFFGRHGGDIQGIEDQLGYIADAGFTAIWSTPLLEDDEPTSSYHGYACTDYYQIDPRFGSNWKYREMVAQAHEHGIKVIMDIVTNHCGDRHWWMEDLPFQDWIHQWPEYTHSNCAFSAQNDPYCSELDRINMTSGWFDTSMVDMNLDNPWLLQYFKQWAVWWIEWADLDGFRVDTYPYNEKVPMSEWCKAVRTEYPNFNIVGEVWSGNVPEVAYWQAENPNRDGFNSNLPSIMDFPLLNAITAGINADGESWDEGITKVYNSIANDQYYQNPQNMMIFPGNHDTDRIGDIVGADPAKQKIVMTLMATLRGYPQIFSGDELLVVSRDRSQGHGGLRVDFPLDWEKDAVMKDMHDYVSTLLNWRKTSDAVQNGNTLHFLTRDNTYAYFRYTDDQAVFVYINNNSTPRELPWADYAEFTGRLSGEGRNVVTGESFNPENCTVPAKSSLIIEYR